VSDCCILAFQLDNANNLHYILCMPTPRADRRFFVLDYGAVENSSNLSNPICLENLYRRGSERISKLFDVIDC
jgi:hypothetical protein